MKVKSKKVTVSAPPKAAEPQARRTAGRKAKVELKPTRASRSKPAAAKAGPLAEGVTAQPVQGMVRLDLTNLTPSGLLSLLKTIKDGLTGNAYYPDFAYELALIAGAENGVGALLETLASLEQQRKACRAALDTEIANAQNAVRSVALACENHDRTDEALLSVGWSLRRLPGPPQPMTVPARLATEPSRFAGRLPVKWGRVANCRFYELQSMPMELLVNGASWANYPPTPCPRANHTLESYPVGAMVSLRVRAVGAAGPGPWSESINARVS